ncbi:hypothetical protein C8024_04270 [Sphingopyxis sp. BSNA05]|uniref:BLUF domain-containing protein n=1 Tax=Sphingopyxis sp. BSNA05 TaxID=1236614 RepID=UPI001D717244|nr:hypothetical protein [Sphingopyxis sp. BSNA05]
MRLSIATGNVSAVKIAAMRKFCVSPRPITSLIFVSTVKPGMDQQDFLAITNVTRRNSERFGLTGLLVCNGFNFMQCIEGERAAVKDRMYHIIQDERHSGIIIVHHSEPEIRQFANIYMDRRYFPAEENSGVSDLPKILAMATVANVTRTMFQSFLSLGFGAANR